MLVLTRKQTETIQIGQDIVIKVIRTGRGSTKLGIDAPQHIRVMRGEVFSGVAAHRRTAASLPPRSPFPLTSKMTDPLNLGVA